MSQQRYITLAFTCDVTSTAQSNCDRARLFSVLKVCMFSQARSTRMRLPSMQLTFVQEQKKKNEG